MEPELRIIDASLNRAGEGLRVAEDFVRFVLDDQHLTSELKSLRHDLAAAAGLLPAIERHAVRNTRGDVGTHVSTAAEGRRGDSWDVCAASLKRIEQALRSLEEYGKLLDANFASRCQSLRYRMYTLEKAIDIGRFGRQRLQEVRLCVLVDGGDSEDDFAGLVRALLEAGVGMIQLRAKELGDRELTDRARILMELVRVPSGPSLQGTGTIVVINDRVDVAVAVQADGVHLGQEDLTVKDARAVGGPRMLVGVSTHRIEQARAAVLDGANYLGAGPTFPSRTKAFNAFAGLSFLREVVAEIRLPTFAIGGITAENLSDVLEIGIPRAAIGAAITSAREPAIAAKEILTMLHFAASRAASHSDSRLSTRDS